MTAARPELTRMTATALARAIARGEVKAAEAVAASLETIAGEDGQLKAFVTTCPEQALAAAQRLDEARAATGTVVGPLHGVPVAIKDLVATAGIRTTMGSLLFRNHVPDADDLVVARLRRAGAVVVGKTNTPEFGFGALCTNEIAGNTRNPYDPALTSGGSSGGSAVAVATGMVPLAHGTDFGGSIRTPASFCNVVGIRPGAGLVARVPKKLPWETLLSHGVLARTVEDAALMLRVMSGGDLRDPVSLHAEPLAVLPEATPELRTLRVGASVDLGIAEIDHEVAKVFETAVRQIAGAGPEVSMAHPDCTRAQEAFETIRAALLFHDLGERLANPAWQPAPTVRWNVERGRDISAKQLLDAEAERGAIYHRFLDFFRTYDVLATVSASVPPFPCTQSDVLEINGRPTRNIIDYLTITYVVSLVGCPAISIPCGMTATGAPVGLQLVARPRDELRLLAFAHLLQEELGFRHRFPQDYPAPRTANGSSA